jgi:hypothetical protein
VAPRIPLARRTTAIVSPPMLPRHAPLPTPMLVR